MCRLVLSKGTNALIMVERCETVKRDRKMGMVDVSAAICRRLIDRILQELVCRGVPYWLAAG